MIAVFKDWTFRAGALTSAFLLAYANLLTYWDHLELKMDIERLCQTDGICMSTIHSFGFPLPVYYGGFLFLATAHNLVIWIVASFLTGLLFRLIWSRFSQYR